jgi:hypothetical protein
MHRETIWDEAIDAIQRGKFVYRQYGNEIGWLAFKPFDEHGTVLPYIVSAAGAPRPVNQEELLGKWVIIENGGGK